VDTLPGTSEFACAGENIGSFRTAIVWSDHFSVPVDALHFNVESLQFTKVPSKGELHLSRWRDPVTGHSENALRSPKGIFRFSTMHLSLARYLIMSDSGWTWLRYNRGDRLFACPAQTPLPNYLARSLTLCTGRLPEFRFTNNGSMRWHAWSGVTPAVAEKIAEKLEQHPIPLVASSRSVDNGKN
jgi:hypothetical protein